MATDNYFNFNVQVYSSKNAAIATLRENVGIWDRDDSPKLLRGEVEATSKRAPGDKANVSLGTKLAVGRALEKAGKALVKEALRESNL